MKNINIPIALQRHLLSHDKHENKGWTKTFVRWPDEFQSFPSRNLLLTRNDCKLANGNGLINSRWTNASPHICFSIKKLRHLDKRHKREEKMVAISILWQLW